MSAHAILSPSSAHRWMACAGALALERACGAPDTSSVHADEGTAAHALAARCLNEGIDAAACIGESIFVNGRDFVVDADMAGHVQTYAAAVRDYGGDRLIEQRVEFSSFVDAPGSTGTADAIVIDDTLGEIQVHDLKFGRGVRVEAEGNEQLMLYALGAYQQFGALGDFTSVLLVVHQPRLGHLSEWACSVRDLLAWADERAKPAAQRAIRCLKIAVEPSDLSPGERQCRWCKAQPTCPALRAEVERAIGAEFDARHARDAQPTAPLDTDALALGMGAVALVESWCAAVRAATERRLLAGSPVAGWKLVEGRRGNRKWADDAAAEAALKAMRLKHDQMYEYSVISPTTAEKLAQAETIGPRQWPKLESLIVRADGKPSVAPVNDKRPALVVTPLADEFDDVSAGALS